MIREEDYDYYVRMQNSIKMGVVMMVRPNWEVEWRAKVEYERRVRVWHFVEHLRNYQVRAAGELRRMGVKIGL